MAAFGQGGLRLCRFLIPAGLVLGLALSGPARAQLRQAIDVIGLLDMGMGFVKEGRELRGNRCLTTNEANARNSQALGVFGAITGAVVVPNFTSRPSDALRGAADGGTLGSALGGLLTPGANTAPTNQARAGDFNICQHFERGRLMREPIVLAMIEEVGIPCGTPRAAFGSGNPEAAPAATWQQLFACARRNPALEAKVSAYLADLGSVNYATCVAARSQAHLQNLQEAARAQASGQGSTMPRAQPGTCNRESPETQWVSVYPRR
jgi:hypothetical protein